MEVCSLTADSALKIIRAPEREPPESSLFLNRELSIIEFNKRVLQMAQDPTVPLLERRALRIAQRLKLVLGYQAAA